MNLIYFIRLVLKHKVILIIVPIIFGALAIALTSNQKQNYYSHSMLYTGIGSGSSIEMDKQFNFLANNNAFDNLINLIKSRETKEEVAVRLLAQHLLLDAPNKAYISESAYKKLQELIPEEISSYLVKSKQPTILKDKSGRIIPMKPWNDKDYEATIENLLKLMNNDNQNFVYSLLNFDNAYYSVAAINEVKVQRMSSSDLLKLSYEADDPGICQQTLKIYNEVLIKKYKNLKENGSDKVVKYFEAKLKEAETNLKKIEQDLLKFNQDNSIINYYEQSKAFAIVKEEMEVKLRSGIAQLAGSNASVKRLENKLNKQELIQEKNNAIVNSKKKLGEISYKIAMLESKTDFNDTAFENIKKLKQEAKLLEKEIKVNVDKLYSFRNSTEGVPIEKVMPDWIDKVVEREDLKAKLNIMNAQKKEMNKQFDTYAPAGANLKRIEREIKVAEQEYLEILHGLNLAKLKFQDVQLTSNIRAVDQPYYPLKPKASKRKIVIIVIAFISAFIVLAIILLMEFFDNTLKNDQVAKKKLKIPSMGMLPKISISNNNLDLIKIQDRLLDFLMHNFNHTLNTIAPKKKPKIITVFSTGSDEGKSLIIGSIAKKLKNNGKKVLFLNHSKIETKQELTYTTPWLYKLLGYQDPRVDYSHPFLANPTTYLCSSEYRNYKLNKSYNNAKSFKKLDFDITDIEIENLDYVFIEFPNILERNYPAELMKNADLALLVCRSNRFWSKADNNILKNIKELVGSKLQFIVNGVVLEEVETLLGELPKNRTAARRKLKDILRFQFNANNQI